MKGMIIVTNVTSKRGQLFPDSFVVLYLYRKP